MNEKEGGMGREEKQVSSSKQENVKERQTKGKQEKMKQ